MTLPTNLTLTFGLPRHTAAVANEATIGCADPEDPGAEQEGQTASASLISNGMKRPTTVTYYDDKEEHLTPSSEYTDALSSAHDALLEVTDLLREAASLTPKGRTEFDLNGWSVMTEQAGYYTRRLLGNVGRLEVER